MKQLLAAFGALALVAAACGGGAAQPSPTAPPAATATATAPPRQIVFAATLSGANEVPPISSEEKSGSGTATVTFDLGYDAAGKITGAAARFVIELTGFPTTTEIILAHIHEAPAGVNGSVKVDTGLTTTAAIKLTTGGTKIERAGILVAADLMSAIVATPANYYVNVHSKLHPGGTVRGQLTKR